MARQGLHDGPYVDPPVANLTTLTATTAEDMWSGAQYTPIFGNDPKAGKIYVVTAFGIVSTAGSGTMTITPFYGTSAGVALGASGAQTVPVSLTNVPWFLHMEICFRVIGAAGANSTCIAGGFWGMSGTLATAGSGCVIPFGGTSASVDATINKDITVRKTLSVAGSFTTQFVQISSRN